MSAGSYRTWGIVCALLGVLAFSFRPILIKLSYAAHPVSPNTLLFLRMSLSLPFFLVIAWWLRRQTPALTRRDWAAVAGLGFLGYYAATLGSPMRATIGMAMFDIVLTPTRGRPLDGWAILIHPIVFWITVWIAWPISLAVALFTPRQQMVQDLVTGTMMVRRSPIVRHWANVRA